MNSMKNTRKIIMSALHSKDLVEKDDDRLERMRESQRKLRSQRKQELEVVRNENLELMRKIEELSAKNELLKKDFMFALSAFDDEMTSKQLTKLVTEGDITPSTLESISLEEFVTFNGYESYDHLYIKGKFVLEAISERNLMCMNKILENYQTFAIKDTPLRYVKYYGLELVSFHLDSMKLLSKGRIPEKWLEKDKLLPKGAMGVEEIIQYLIKHCDNPIMNMEIVVAFISRFSFGTLHGIAIFQFDLARALKYGLTNNFDEAYLMGTVDETMCVADRNQDLFAGLMNR